MHGKQPYDPVNNTLVVNHVYGDDDTSLLAKLRLRQVDQGWHGVRRSAPVASSASSKPDELVHHPHGRPEGKACPLPGMPHRAGCRLAGITDIYLPGRDTNRWFWSGWPDDRRWAVASCMVVSVRDAPQGEGANMSNASTSTSSGSSASGTGRRPHADHHPDDHRLRHPRRILIFRFQESRRNHTTLAAWTCFALWDLSPSSGNSPPANGRQYLASRKNVDRDDAVLHDRHLHQPPHPFRTTVVQAQPLQRLAYLGDARLVIVGPLIWVSGGLFYLSTATGPAWSGPEPVAEE